MGMQNPIISGLLQFAGGAATSYKKERDDAKAAETKIRTMGIDEQNKRETMSHEALLREKESKRIAASPTGQANERKAVAGASLAEKQNENYESPLAKTVRETKDAAAKALEAEKAAKKTAQLKEKRAEDIQSAKDTFRGLVGSYAKGQSNGKALIKWASSPQGKLLDGTPFWNRAGLDEIATGVLPPQDQDLVDQVEAAEAADRAGNKDVFQFDGKGNDAGATAKPEGIGQGEAPPTPAPVVGGAPEDTSSADESDIEGALMPPPAGVGGAGITSPESTNVQGAESPLTMPPDNSATVPPKPPMTVAPDPNQNVQTPQTLPEVKSVLPAGKPPQPVVAPQPEVATPVAMGDDSLDVGPDAGLDLEGVEEPATPTAPSMGVDDERDAKWDEEEAKDKEKKDKILAEAEDKGSKEAGTKYLVRRYGKEVRKLQKMEGTKEYRDKTGANGLNDRVTFIHAIADKEGISFSAAKEIVNRYIGHGSDVEGFSKKSGIGKD